MMSENEYQYILKTGRRRSMSVTITNKGEILVKAPLFTTKEEAEKFLHSKKDWILKNLEAVKKQNEEALKNGILSEEELKDIKKRARKILMERTEYFSGIMGVSYGRISIRCQKSRWGSCSFSGNLNFNCLLVLMPPEILDSVVVHELAHRRHMNHSKAFYAEILKVMPDYREREKWLKKNGLSFLNRLPE